MQRWRTQTCSQLLQNDSNLDRKIHAPQDLRNFKNAAYEIRIPNITILKQYSMDDGSLHAITSLRWPNRDDIPLSWHHARLLASASALDWKDAGAVLSPASATAQIERAIEKHILTTSADRTRMQKLTIRVSPNGRITVTSAALAGPLYDFRLLATTPAEENAAVYISPKVTNVSVFTTHKTSLRKSYNEAREAVSISDLPPTAAEVLLYNQENEMTEASLSTVYFQRGNTWITPPASSGCNIGLTRKLALEKNWCKEGRVLKSELRHGEMIKLSNCVRGFWSGRIFLAET